MCENGVGIAGTQIQGFKLFFEGSIEGLWAETSIASSHCGSMVVLGIGKSKEANTRASGLSFISKLDPIQLWCTCGWGRRRAGSCGEKLGYGGGVTKVGTQSKDVNRGLFALTGVRAYSVRMGLRLAFTKDSNMRII